MTTRRSFLKFLGMAPALPAAAALPAPAVVAPAAPVVMGATVAGGAYDAYAPGLMECMVSAGPYIVTKPQGIYRVGNCGPRGGLSDLIWDLEPPHKP